LAAIDAKSQLQIDSLHKEIVSPVCDSEPFDTQLFFGAGNLFEAGFWRQWLPSINNSAFDLKYL